MKTIFCTNNEILTAIKERNPFKNERYLNGDDISNGLLFADVFGEVLRYNVTANQWFVFDGVVWREDTGGLITEGVSQRFQRAFYLYSADATPSFQKSVLRLGSRSARVTMVQEARNYHSIDAKMLDADGSLLNCRNGILNLQTFELLEHDPSYLLSKCANVIYRPDARSELFESFIDSVMVSDADKTRYLQKLLGYSLTDQSNREEAYLLYGATTRNGKSTLLETYSCMLGDYALNMQPETLAQTKRDSRSASGDIARLAGCRFLHVSEPPKRMIFDVALLKTLLGRDRITARHLYEREFEFTPTFKLCINTNYLPTVNDDTLFSSGRLKVIPFERHFTEEEQDKTLKDRLQMEDNLSGLFTWCLEGLRLYREEGLIPPESIVRATQAYRDESDKVKQFISDCLEEKEDSIIEGKALYETYVEWCHSNGFGCENKRNFFDELKGKKLLSATGTVGGRTVRNVVKGYRIVIDLTRDPGFQRPNLANQNELDGLFST